MKCTCGESKRLVDIHNREYLILNDVADLISDLGNGWMVYCFIVWGLNANLTN